MNHICLIAIFRNEAKNVARCLDAAKETIDCVSIVDTGSDDDTPQLIAEWGELNGVPTAIHHEAFENFGHNRTRSVMLAREAFPDATHFLLLDADMVLRGDLDLRTCDLEGSSFLLRQSNALIEYWNVRIIRSDCAWVCRGVTHEYWESVPPSQPVKIEGLWIDDLGDGGHKAEKFDRDFRLLSQALADPNIDGGLRMRYTFYLAQTLRDMGKLPEAREAYSERAALGGWNEEVFVALLERAKLGISVQLPHEQVIAEHLDAFSARPTRAEPLHSLARYCREKQRFAEGYMFAKMGLTIPRPKSDVLFLAHPVYEWELLDEFSVCAYWIGEYRESELACRQLLNGVLLPAWHRSRVQKNLHIALDRQA